MKIKNIHFLVLVILVIAVSCSPKNFSTKYYYKNEKVLDSIEQSYKTMDDKTPFNIAFTSKGFNVFSVGIVTDTLTYIYEFSLNESRLTDTLTKYHLDAPKVEELIRQMRSIKCIWINKYNYYVDEKKNSLIYLSIKPALRMPFSPQKYYILSYFKAPQYFDSEGRLLDKRRRRRLRKINGEIFKKINDKVCYTVSNAYR